MTRHTTLDPKQTAATFWRVMNRDSAGKETTVFFGFRDYHSADRIAQRMNSAMDEKPAEGWYYPEEEVLGE